MHGAVAEWFRRRSAKPLGETRMPVRVRSAPQVTG